MTGRPYPARLINKTKLHFPFQYWRFLQEVYEEVIPPIFPFDRNTDPAQLRVTMQFLIQASAPFIKAEGITGYAVGTSGLLLYGLGSGGGKIGGAEEEVFKAASGGAL